MPTSSSSRELHTRVGESGQDVDDVEVLDQGIGQLDQGVDNVCFSGHLGLFGVSTTYSPKVVVEPIALHESQPAHNRMGLA
jgi:hypothetical protein